MGSSTSSQYSNSSNENTTSWEVAKQNARKIYDYRVKHYNPTEHGPRHYYMLQVEAEYELECIPKRFRGMN
jgi:hypothetical protein